MKRSSFKNAQGFTLVELVVVIVVLGLLAAAALPRFINVTDQAKEASIEAVAGGYATAVLSARAQWEAEGRPLDTSDTYNLVDYDGQDFWLSSSDTTNFRDGYPYAVSGTDTGERSTGTTNPQVNENQCVRLMEELLQNPPSVSSATTNNPKYLAEIDTNTKCKYIQQEGKEHSFTYDITSGSVSIDLVQ